MTTRQGTTTHQDRVRPDSDRLARWLRRLRWPLLAVWLIAIVLLDPLANGLSKATNDTASAYLPASAQSTKVVAIEQSAAKASASTTETDQLVVVFARAGGLTRSDQSAITAAHSAVARRAGHVAGLGAPGPLVPSSDGDAALFSANVTSTTATAGDTDAKAVQAARAAVAAAMRPARSGLQTEVTGAAGMSADSNTGSKQDSLLLTSVLIVVVILLVVYRSPILWLLPLIGAAGAITVTKASVHGLANAGLTVSSLSSAIMTVLIFGAATDYALLLVHRYRDELRHHEFPEAAMATTLRRVLPTLAASAATVTCAMLCLLVANSASLRGLGPVGAVSIVVAFGAQVTLLPALLLVIGRAAFWPRIPRYGAIGREDSRFWAAIAERVARRPAVTAGVMVVLLGAACVGLMSLRTDNDPVDDIPGNPASVVGEHAIEAHYPAGDLAPLTILVPKGQAASAARVAHGVPGIGSVTAGTPVSGYANYTAVMSVAPYGSAGAATIGTLRQRLAGPAPGALVGGAPAIQYDGAQTASHDDAVLIPMVMLVILVIIGLLLRAVVAPLVLVATTALSFGAAFGLASLVWRYLLGFHGVQSVIPIYIFIFLVALGVDYNIFLSDRIREESRAAGLHAGTLRGVGVTGGVITAAGIVLAGTFAALAQIPEVELIEVGVAVALGVLLDTLLVRTVLVPAGLLAIGDRVWWPSRPRPVPARP